MLKAICDRQMLLLSAYQSDKRNRATKIEGEGEPSVMSTVCWIPEALDVWELNLLFLCSLTLRNMHVIEKSPNLQNLEEILWVLFLRNLTIIGTSCFLPLKSALIQVRKVR